jgi:hypothetical protein
MTRRLPPSALSLVGLALTFPTCAVAQDAKDGAAERTKVVRATYRETPATALGIKEPITVTQFTEQKLPKSVILVLADADGVTHDFRWWTDTGKTQNREYDRLYWLRGTGRAQQGPFRLAVRGPEEAALYGLLLRYTAARDKAKALGAFETLMLQGAKAFVDRLDERFGGETPTLQK